MNRQIKKIRCRHCRRLVRENPRIKNQDYCGEKACQQARKNAWRRKQRAEDPEYRRGEEESREKWLANQPGYGKKKHHKQPKLQGARWALAGDSTEAIAGESKRDALMEFFVGKTMKCNFYPITSPTTLRRDALVVEIVPISTG